jgi:hypothetical protein
LRNLQHRWHDDLARAAGAEGGGEQPAVGDAQGHEIAEPAAVVVHDRTLLGGQGRKGKVANHGGPVIARERLLCQHTEELLARLCGQPEPAWLLPWPTCRAHRFVLDERFERHAVAVVARRAYHRVWRDGSGVVAGQARLLSTPARHHRRAVVLALELAELPLARQHPERIVEPGLQAGVHLGVAAARFQAYPAGDRWVRNNGRHGVLYLITVKSVETVAPVVLYAKYAAGK